MQKQTVSVGKWQMLFIFFLNGSQKAVYVVEFQRCLCVHFVSSSPNPLNTLLIQICDPKQQPP